MIEKISAPVSVGLLFDHKLRTAVPKWVKWDGKLYKIDKVGFHHTYREGRVLYHVFSVASKTLFFRLVLNTETLNWRLEELSDGLPD
jgi:hypothetical protein